MRSYLQDLDKHSDVNNYLSSTSDLFRTLIKTSLRDLNLLQRLQNQTLKISTAILGTGILMTIVGFIAFSAVQEQPSSDIVRIIKDGGAFTGLLGIGTSIGGTLLYIIDRYNVAV